MAAPAGIWGRGMDIVARGSLVSPVLRRVLDVVGLSCKEKLKELSQHDLTHADPLLMALYMVEQLLPSHPPQVLQVRGVLWVFTHRDM